MKIYGRLISRINSNSILGVSKKSLIKSKGTNGNSKIFFDEVLICIHIFTSSLEIRAFLAM